VQQKLLGLFLRPRLEGADEFLQGFESGLDGGLAGLSSLPLVATLFPLGDAPATSRSAAVALQSVRNKIAGTLWRGSGIP